MAAPAAHSRASLADALATVTPLLTRETGSRPPASKLRAALYGHAFNPRQRSLTPDPVTASALAWLERASLPVGQLSDPRIIRAGLDGLCTLLDGSPAAVNTNARKRAVFHGALGYATARTTSSASGSKTPSTQTRSAHRRHSAGKQAVMRTVGNAPDPVRYLSVNQPLIPRIARARHARPVRTSARLGSCI